MILVVAFLQGLPPTTGSALSTPRMLFMLLVLALMTSVIIVGLYFVLAYLRKLRTKSVSVEIQELVERQKDELLRLAELKKKERELREKQAEEERKRREEDERIIASINLEKFYGHLCPITGVELTEEDRIVVWVEEDQAYAYPAVEELKRMTPVGKGMTLVYFPEGRVERFVQRGKP